MKNIIFIFSVLFVFQSMLLSAQSIAVNRTISFSYDLNGNITSRKGTSLPSKPIGGNEKTDISGDISIIGKDNKFTIDLRKDYNSTAKFQVNDLSPIVVKSGEFSTQTFTVDMNDCPSGVYIFNVTVDDKNGTRKIIKN